MNRCSTPSLLSNRKRRWLITVMRATTFSTTLASALFSAWLTLAASTVLTTLPLAVLAQTAQREFPKQALRAVMVVTAPPQIMLNGTPERLSPGARIKSQNNTLVLSGALVGQELQVNYVRDPQGLVHEVWILSAQEAQQKRAGLFNSNIVFSSDANKPKTDDGKTPFHQLPKFPAQ